MSRSYKTREWVEFRAEVIELDNGACRRCGRSPQKHGVVLQVHHTVYHPGKPLWQYAYAECLTLCKGCHAEEHGHIMPKTGWDLVYQDDLGDLVGTCEKCGTSIRHVFYIDHPNWEGLTVGTYCCDSLTNTVEASEFMKRKDQRNDRLKTFLVSPQWKRQDDGHHIKRAHMRFRLAPEEGGYRIHIQERRGKELYPTLQEAQVKVFDLLDDGTAIRILLDHGVELEKPRRKGKVESENPTGRKPP